MALKSPEGVHRPENYTNRFLLVQGTPEKYWSLAPPLDCCKNPIPPPPPRSKHRPGFRVTVAKSRLWVHNTVPTLSGGAKPAMHDAREHLHRMFLATFCTFPLWDRTGCLKQWEFDKGRERKTTLWSAIENFRPPPPHLHRPLFRVWPLFRFWTPPPPPRHPLRTDPYSGLTFIPGSTLRPFKKKRKIKKLWPKMTKIVSRGSCLKIKVISREFLKIFVHKRRENSEH